jgi:hypothetical protein
MLAVSRIATRRLENSGTEPVPPRSTQASANKAYRNVAQKTPSEWNSAWSRANQRTRRGEYAMALNCTMTKAMANTMPVSAIMPEAAADR